MSLKVAYSIKAEHDLASIFRYISTETSSEAPAERYLTEIVAAITTIADLPGIGTARPDLSPEPGIRIFPVRSHVVVYQVERDKLNIIRVLHGAQDLPSRLQNNEGRG